ncbi:MAG TPA: DUF4197 domain-containing protein [Bacteroidia bacterium]|nr:DUF4197 domain-containing protein [Bacteroidia bacterium]
MRTAVIVFSMASLLLTAAQAQQSSVPLFNSIKNTIGSTGSENDKIISGLKEALVKGAGLASDTASRPGGYYLNPEIKIPFPPEAKEMEKKVRSAGMNHQADEFIRSMNEAAENAAKASYPIFKNTITKMTVTDGRSIITGSDSAATHYLRQKAESELREAYTPIVRKSIEEASVARYWTDLATYYNKIPFVKKVNPDLEAYVTSMALDGLFHLIAEQEASIRNNPEARTTELLQEVFGKK